MRGNDSLSTQFRLALVYRGRLFRPIQHAKLKKNSRSDDASYLTRHIVPRFGSRLAFLTIATDDLAGLHADIGRESPYAANRLLEVVRKMYNLGRKWDLVPLDLANPASGVERFSETKRRRFVTPDRTVGSWLVRDGVSLHLVRTYTTTRTRRPRPDMRIFRPKSGTKPSIGTVEMSLILQRGRFRSVRKRRAKPAWFAAIRVNAVPVEGAIEIDLVNRLVRVRGFVDAGMLREVWRQRDDCTAESRAHMARVRVTDLRNGFDRLAGTGTGAEH